MNYFLTAKCLWFFPYIEHTKTYLGYHVYSSVPSKFQSTYSTRTCLFWWHCPRHLHFARLALISSGQTTLLSPRQGPFNLWCWFCLFPGQTPTSSVDLRLYFPNVVQSI